MRDINRIVLHCSATVEGKEYSVDTIRNWHTAKGWSDIGYHYVISLDGCIDIGRPVDKQGAHVRGHNKDTIGICYIGGVDADIKPKDTMTPEQEDAFRQLVASIRTLFGEDITIHGHNEFSSKACPSFTVKEKFSDLY
tara:strand:+ start:2296 stop:2709 length:414 start_codon:yes stop_codon:yes gene_type:complete